jgi:plasmid maintenance system killer protein
MNIDSFNLDCRIIKRWLNNFFREEKVRDFPTDLSQNGEILLKLLHKLTNKKEFDGNWEF